MRANSAVAILQSNYIPWKGYFDLLAASEYFVVYDDVQYTKNDWRNRNRIKLPAGAKWLTIPTNGSTTKKINQVEVKSRSWRAKHWKTISQAYARAEFFQSYAAAFQQLYLDSEETNLSRINVEFIKLICAQLGIRTKIISVEDLSLSRSERSERLVEICKKLGVGRYISGPAAKRYINRSIFASEGIEIDWMDYQGYPEYKQLGDEFEHQVSILDLIFNMGPDSKSYMKYAGDSNA